MNDEQHMALVRLGVDGPGRWTQGLTEEAVAGVIAWARDQAKAGKHPTSGQISMKLKNGGLTGYGLDRPDVQAWWRTSKGRWTWMQGHLEAKDDPYWAEAAVIELVSRKQEPNLEGVRAMAFQLEMEQQEYEAQLAEGRK
jgi:hypothetical protein